MSKKFLILSLLFFVGSSVLPSFSEESDSNADSYESSDSSLSADLDLLAEGEDDNAKSVSGEKPLDSDGTDSESSEDDPFDVIFSNAEDAENPVVTEETENTETYNVSIGTLKIPLEVTGSLAAEFGFAYINEDHSNDGSIYFDFDNAIYFTTRPDKYLALKGTLKTEMPDSGEASSDGQNNFLYLYEMYFDYLMFDRIYITAGKKKITWGNIRLFTDSDYYSDENALATNILYDSRQHISGMVRIPFGVNTLSFVGMYKGGGTSAASKDMSFAANAELVFLGTSLNLFGRRFPTDSDYLPIIGAELKRTLFGVDFYGQELCIVSSGTKLKDLVETKFDDKTAFDKMITTGGFYKLLLDGTPRFGVNAEYQLIYDPVPGDSDYFFINRFAVNMGLGKLGKEKNINFVFQWNHNITEKSGIVQGGLVLSGILPHCDWRNGGKFEYGDDYEYGKFTVGSYLHISLNY